MKLPQPPNWRTYKFINHLIPSNCVGQAGSHSSNNNGDNTTPNFTRHNRRNHESSYSNEFIVKRSLPNPQATHRDTQIQRTSQQHGQARTHPDDNLINIQDQEYTTSTRKLPKNRPRFTLHTYDDVYFHDPARVSFFLAHAHVQVDSYPSFLISSE